MKDARHFIFIFIITLLIILAGCGKTQDKKVPDEQSTAVSEPVKQTADTDANTTSSSEISPSTEPAIVRIEAGEIKEPTSIDVSAINIVKDAINQVVKVDFFVQYAVGTELAEIDDLQKYQLAAGESDLIESLKNIDNQEHRTDIHLVDIDNDGSDEIAVSQYQGGTMGIVYFAVLKKDAKGEYAETIDFDYENGITFSLSDTLSFARLGDKNYLCVENVDYNDKAFSGISLYSFVDGKYDECAVIKVNANSTFTVEKSPVDAQYSKYMDSIEIKDAIAITHDCEVRRGTAETVSTASENYTADINNDGVDESLQKYYRATSSYYMASYLNLKIGSTDVNFDADPLKAITGEAFDDENSKKILQQFWCDRCDDKNLVNILYRNNFESMYQLDIYFLSGNTSQKIGWVKATPDTAIGTKYLKYSYVPVEE